ncbi:hypothetical protein DN062_04290 [Nitrincola tibetensis]|uniref:Uncharacterized protein n=1 Tax=Nitrincola tibetensis TaxID=2219697 RepID=A0A364NRH1_9GAMM|nr:hypothetical protein [Nitrincola tibetensis]RAU19477.1 hypothetical protein DN062_04290 [Nitrincola tibetensis]
MLKFIKNNIAIIVSLAVLLLAVIFFTGVYFITFSGGASTKHSDWDDFGSYVSGTIGVLAACLAVVWLMISVHLQKIELRELKAQLAESENEQKKQTHIGALSAVLNSSVQTLAQYQNILIALNSGEAHLHPMEDGTSIHMRVDDEFAKMTFYQKQMERYLQDKYPEKQRDHIDDIDSPF